MEISRELDRILNEASRLSDKLCKYNCPCNWIDVLFWAHKKQRHVFPKLTLLDIMEKSQSGDEAFQTLVCEMRVLLI